jgi:hypothetical protein
MPGENEDLSLELDAALEEQAAAAGEGGTDGQGGADGAAPANGEGSSASQTQSDDDGLLGVVRDAAKPKEPDAAAAASSADGAEGKGDKPGEGAPKRDDENFSDVPFNKHPRFRQLLSERNTFKTDAGKYRQIDTFLQDNGMSNEEAANLLTVGAMAKTDPAKAWEMARPWVENLLKAAGEVLSDELVAAVREGRMTQEAALELSRSRAAVASAGAMRTFEQQRQERTAATDHQRSITDAAQTWEDTRRERDPNFDAKVEQIHRELAWRHRNGDIPKDAAGVTAQLNDVYKVVNAAMKPATPPAAATAPAGRPAAPKPAPKPAVRAVVGGSVASGQAKAAPKNMLEVVQGAAP